MPIDAAEVLEHAEDRISAREVFPHLRCAVDREPAALAQHQEPSGVVDLGVDQHDGANPGVADGSPGCSRGKARSCESTSGEALNRIQSMPVGRNRDGGLGPRPRADRALAHAVAVAAVAVPLREAAAGGRPEHPYAHKKQGPLRGPGLGTGRG
jgi:hypothetical protein